MVGRAAACLCFDPFVERRRRPPDRPESPEGFLQVGGGIVADSVPEREFNETLHKAKGMLRAVSAGIAERPS